MPKRSLAVPVALAVARSPVRVKAQTAENGAGVSVRRDVFKYGF